MRVWETKVKTEKSMKRQKVVGNHLWEDWLQSEWKRVRRLERGWGWGRDCLTCAHHFPFPPDPLPRVLGGSLPAPLPQSIHGLNTRMITAKMKRWAVRLEWGFIQKASGSDKTNEQLFVTQLLEGNTLAIPHPLLPYSSPHWRLKKPPTPIRLSAGFSKETLQARRDWPETFRVMKSRDLQPRLLYPAKIPFRIERQEKSFPEKKKLKEFIIT